MKSKDFKFNESFFITIMQDDKPLIFVSNNYKISEIEFLSLIRICYKEGRRKQLGKILLSIYKESAKDSIDKLKSIGIDENETKKARDYKRR